MPNKSLFKELEKHESWKKVSEICRKYGYKLAIMVENANTKIRTLQLVPVAKFAPQIYYMDKNAFNDKPAEYYFGIQSTSYGELGLEDHKEFIKDITNANQMVEELTKELETLEWPVLAA